MAGLPKSRRHIWKPVLAAATAVLVWSSCVSLQSWCFAKDLTLQRRTSSPKSEAKPWATPVSLMELEVASRRSHVDKVFVPSDPEVASQWSGKYSAMVARPLTAPPQLHVKHVSRLARCGGSHGHASRAEELRIFTTQVTVDAGPLASLGPVWALRVVFRVRIEPGVLRSELSGLPLVAEIFSKGAYPGGQSYWRWLLVPFVILALPTLVCSSKGFLIMVVGMCMNLIWMAIILFLLVVGCAVLRYQIGRHLGPWRRLSRLKGLKRTAQFITAAFGDTGPCCICLGESTRRDDLIVLLPCRHALHDECYGRWVGVEAYPAQDLICPLCRRRADAVGKLTV